MAQETTTSDDWREAGEAWGDRATDWAYLWEPYARSANRAVFDQLAVADGTRLLDIACGSGFAAHLASERGAAVSGIDASEGLVTIARARTPKADFRVGDMFALPFPGASFDAATSFNGIWKGCEAALLEARRVLVPGGRLGLTFWGRFEHLGLMPYFVKVIELSGASHAAANVEHGDTQNVIEDMLQATGFERLERGTVTVVKRMARHRDRRPRARLGRSFGPGDTGSRPRPLLRRVAQRHRTHARSRSRDPHQLRIRLDHCLLSIVPRQGA